MAVGLPFHTQAEPHCHVMFKVVRAYAKQQWTDVV